MIEIPPIGGQGQVAGVSAESRRSDRPAGPAGRTHEPDTVEISEVGQALSASEPVSLIRADKVAEIRSAIAAGTYLTDEKLAIAAQRLWNALQGAA